MTAPDRIPCLKPGCRRTGKRVPGDPTDIQIVCGKCWKTLPPRLRDRYKQLNRRRRKLDRLFDKEQRELGHRMDAERWRKRAAIFDLQWGRLWDDIKRSLQTPDKPEGLEAFLEEMKMTDD